MQLEWVSGLTVHLIDLYDTWVLVSGLTVIPGVWVSGLTVHLIDMIPGYGLVVSHE